MTYSPKKKYDNSVYSKRFREKNPEKMREYSRRYHQRNLEKVRLKAKCFRLRRDYGITLEQRDQMVFAQGGRCAVCSETFGGGARDIHVDHCHATGKVRALLCNGCNNMLGRSKDNPDLLRLGAAYLELHRPGEPPAQSRTPNCSGD